MKGLSLIRQVSIEDISDLTPRRGSVVKKVKLNRPPQLEDVDERIGHLVDILVILEHSLNKLEHDYFHDVPEEESVSIDVEMDETWTALHQEYNDELQEKDREYDALLERFSRPAALSPREPQ
jgi:hypothetical protein